MELESAESERDRLKSMEDALQSRVSELTRSLTDLQSKHDAAQLRLQSHDSLLRTRDSQLAQIRTKEADLERK